MLNYTSSEFKLTGNITEDMPRYFELYGHRHTAEHCTAVAANAAELAERFGCDPSKAALGGYLHDISAVIPIKERVDFAHSQSVEVLPAEAQHAMILHQKLSVVIAKEVFDVSDHEVLSAIGCHTTLKPKAARLDKVVFLADKISWDRKGKPPYFKEVIGALEDSLDAAVLAYMNYLWARPGRITIPHPWFVAARDELLAQQLSP